uniref:Putative ixodes 10 kDa peptide protein n=1 Tax=Ixodes ricinus TaxID=34613 RepID=A0A0K8RBW8_IXORI
MQLVVFAVMLILPSLQSDGSSFGSVIHDDCADIIDRAGEMNCGLVGSGDIDDYDPNSCTVRCTGGARPKLPLGVCSGDGVSCTPIVREGLRNWEQKMRTILHNVLAKWCQSCPKK